jgi:hydrogenase/urease accessory protein HupE
MSARRFALGLLALLLVLTLVPTARAHEFRPALLRLEQRADAQGSFDLRLIPPKLSSAGPIAPGELTPIVPAHCQLRSRSDVAYTLDCGEQGLVGELGVAGLDRHPIDVMVEVGYADATRYTGVLGPDDPTTLIADDAVEQRGSVFSDYLLLGVEHILIGLDHLLFVLGLVLLVRARDVPSAPASGRDPTIRRLLWTVTAFTLAHSITLAASTLELVQLPSAPVEAGIALSILLLARELAQGIDGHDTDTLTWRFPWLVAFSFGLLHGFGFAGALSEIGLPPSQTPLALLAFNLGVEAGQLGVVALLLLSFAGLRRLAAAVQVGARAELIVRKLPIWAMGALAFAWTLERVLGFWA